VLRLLAAIQKEGWRSEVRRYKINTESTPTKTARFDNLNR